MTLPRSDASPRFFSRRELKKREDSILDLLLVVGHGGLWVVVVNVTYDTLTGPKPSRTSLTMTIELEGPTFQNSADEENFFSCIYALPGYISVRGHGTRLEISFEGSADQAVATERVDALCRRWGTAAVFTSQEPTG